MSIKSGVIHLGIGETTYPTAPQFSADGIRGRVAVTSMSGDPDETVCVSFDGVTDHLHLHRASGNGKFTTLGDAYDRVWLRGRGPLLTAATVQIVLETSDT